MNIKLLMAPTVLFLAACIPCAAAKVTIQNKSSKVVLVVVDASQKASMKKDNAAMTPVDPNKPAVTLFAGEETTLETSSRKLGGDIWLTIQKGDQSTNIRYPRMKNKWETVFGGTVPVQISAKGDVVEVK